MNNKWLALKPPRIAQALVVSAILVHWLSPVGLHLYSSIVLGTVMLAAGFSVMMAAWWCFRERRTPICPADTPTSLVVEGVYRITRHPMYLGMFVMLLGLAVIIGSAPFFVAAIAFLLVMDTVFCPYEENKLSQLFGRDYLDYKKQVRRWL